MHYIFTVFLFTILSLDITAQPLQLQRAIIHTKTVVSAIDDSAGTAPKYMQTSEAFDDVFNRKITPTELQTAQQSGNRRIFVNAQPITAVINTNAPVTMESITWFSGHKQKIVTSSSQWTSTTVRDNLSGKNVTQTVPVINLPGATNARIYSASRVYYDQKPDDNPLDSAHSAPTVNIIYQDIERKIAGYNCKRAVVNITDKNATYRAIVWYNTEIKLVGLPVAGDPAFGFAYHGFSKKLAFFDQLAGFPMEFEMDWGNNRMLKVEVTKMNVTKPVRDGVFSLLKEGD